eukprot:981028-Alexandrium_andersonii.AAC.1
MMLVFARPPAHSGPLSPHGRLGRSSSRPVALELSSLATFVEASCGKVWLLRRAVGSCSAPFLLAGPH